MYKRQVYTNPASASDVAEKLFLPLRIYEKSFCRLIQEYRNTNTLLKSQKKNQNIILWMIVTKDNLYNDAAVH